jgi:hypothetical protein
MQGPKKRFKKGRDVKCVFHSLARSKCSKECVGYLSFGNSSQSQIEHYREVWERVGARGVWYRDGIRRKSSQIINVDEFKDHLTTLEREKKSSSRTIKDWEELDVCIERGNKILETHIPAKSRIGNLESFQQAYSNVRGTAVRFVREKVGWKFDSQGAIQMTVKEYVEWYNITVKSHSSFRAIKEAFYLTDIPITDSDLALRRGTCAEMDVLSSGGKLDLNYYVKQFDKDIALPSMKALGYLAPPWLIGTNIHYDGFGGQFSLHTYVFGPEESYQQVWIYPRLDYNQEIVLRRICELPAPYSPQQLPHAFDYVLDTDLECWDVEKQRLLENIGICGQLFKVKPGQTIVLPAGMAHVFKKCLPNVQSSYKTVGFDVEYCWRCFVCWTNCQILSSKCVSSATIG